MFDAPFVQNMLTPVLAIIGTITGLTGTFLGWLNFNRRYRVKLEVQATPYCNHSVEELVDFRLDIRVVNHSVFPVSLVSVGFLLREAGTRRRTCAELMEFRGHHTTRPKRLEPRSDMVFPVRFMTEPRVLGYSNLTRSELVDQVVAVYADTATGHRFTCGDKGLKSFKKMGKVLSDTGTIQRDYF